MYLVYFIGCFIDESDARYAPFYILLHYYRTSTIDYVEKTKYLGYMFTNHEQNDVEMLRQLRLLYMRLNKIIRMFHFRIINVKLELFKSLCTSFYCCYQLWVQIYWGSLLALIFSNRRDH